MPAEAEVQVEETNPEAETAEETPKTIEEAAEAKSEEVGTASKEQKAEVKRLKIQIDGKEEDLSEQEAAALIAEARKSAQIKREGYKKFEEAAALRKQFSGIKDILHQDPEAGIVELAQLFGLPQDVLDRIYARRSQFEQAWSQMNDDQKARWIAERRTASLEAEQHAQKAQEQQAKAEQEYQGRLQSEEKRLAENTLPAMQKAGIPATHLTVKMVAATLGALADRNPDEPPNIDEAVEYVAGVWHEVTTGFINTFEKDPGAFIKRYPGLSEALRKHQVAQATGKAPGLNGRAPAPRATQPASQQDGKAQTWTEFSKQIKALQRGEPL